MPRKKTQEEVTKETGREPVKAKTMKKGVLTARRPILHDGRVYRVGDTLPENDRGKTAEWTADGSAVWE
jgi:hypothetical protein